MVLWIQVKTTWVFSLFWKDIYIPFTEMIDLDDAGRAKQTGKKGYEEQEANPKR